MNRHAFGAAFATGLLVLAWVARSHVGGHALALTMTTLIGAFYLMGALELRRFRQDTAGLDRALAAVNAPLPSLSDWLATLPASLRPSVQQRVEGERVGLPGPLMTPYLVGLLVLLGMLGTFLGMVVTLNGAALAMDSTADLATLRAALTQPVQGLGLAFGTSVAGVAASAMLGLMSALCRRDRLLAAVALDQCRAGPLRQHSQAHQRELTLLTLQAQAGAMPALVDKLETMMLQMAQHSQTVNAQLLAGQQGFARRTQSDFTALASSVDQSLRHSLSESARLAGATLQPVAEATMAAIAGHTTRHQHQVADLLRARLDAVAEQVDRRVADLAQAGAGALAEHQRSSLALTDGLQTLLQGFSQGFEQSAGALLASVDQAHGGLRAELQAADQQRLLAMGQAQSELLARLEQQTQRAQAQALDQQQAICQTLAHTGRELVEQVQAQASGTIDEVAGLMRSAAEAPRAAAALMGQLRQQLSDSMARDNGLLEERGRLMASLSSLLGAAQQGWTEQREAIESLVASSAGMLQQLGERFQHTMAAESGQLGSVAAQITGSAVEVASMGEAFGDAVQQFGESNQALLAQLQRTEAALAKSGARSDEQLAYYVAQARELIDLSLLSQQQIVAELQQRTGPGARAHAELASEAG